MQPDLPVPHGQEGHGQHQRDRDAHHQAGADVQRPAAPQRLAAGTRVQAEAQEAHGEHDHDGLDEHLHELVHGRRHRAGLVLHVHEAHACRQGLLDAARGGVQRFAEADDVAALGHRHAQRDDFPALVVHLDGGRIDVAAADLGDVAQPQLCARGAPDRHRAQFLDGAELSGHADLYLVLRGLDGACALDGVLLAKLVQDLVHVQAELGEPLLRDFDVDLLVLDAELLDLGDILDAQQLLADVVGEGLEFGRAEPFRLDRVDHAIDIAEFIVEERPLHPLRQGGAHVADLLAHGVPDAGHFAGR